MTTTSDLDAIEKKLADFVWPAEFRELLEYSRAQQQRIAELETNQQEIYKISRNKDWQEGPFEIYHAFHDLEQIMSICLTDQATQASHDQQD